MKAIAAAVDFSDATPNVVTTAAALAHQLQAKLVLLHVVAAEAHWVDSPLDGFTVSTHAIPDLAKEACAHREKRLLELAMHTQLRDVVVSVVVAHGAFIEAICNELNRLEPSLIVMGSHHHGAMHDLLLGNLPARVVRKAACPVLIVHPDDDVDTLEPEGAEALRSAARL